MLTTMSAIPLIGGQLTGCPESNRAATERVLARALSKNSGNKENKVRLWSIKRNLKAYARRARADLQRSVFAKEFVR